MHLKEIFMTLSDSTPEQRVYVVVYVFEEDGKEYQYDIEFTEGMDIEDFKIYFKRCAKQMKYEDPYQL